MWVEQWNMHESRSVLCHSNATCILNWGLHSFVYTFLILIFSIHIFNRYYAYLVHVWQKRHLLSELLTTVSCLVMDFTDFLPDMFSLYSSEILALYLRFVLLVKVRKHTNTIKPQ